MMMIGCFIATVRCSVARCSVGALSECGNRKCSVLCPHKNSCYNLAQPIVRFGCWLSVIESELAEKVVQHRVMQTCIASADLLNVLELDI